ncbi:MAG: hypothetical protein ABSG86_07885 [Thermoguttaceae bacterium]|jgi:hypothetical protein
MSASPTRRNRSGLREAPRVSLFPFLAVLICTMGALVLLLLAVTRQARLQAIHAARAQKSEREADALSQREMVRWRIDALQKSRRETESQLADSRLVLGHLEDHARRLRQQLPRLAAAWQGAEQSGAEALRRRNVTQNEIAETEAQVATAQKHLAEAQQAARNRPRSYAIIPYEGPNQTRRRPIYLECRSDGIVLRPENIVFSEDDFDGPQGPGNPLAAALRAAREFLLTQGGFDAQNGGEPYPLLLVRPGGINFYYAARGAMKSWASEFGYELIGEDWKLKFPQADGNLARVAQQAVQLARVEQQQLIAAAPSRWGKRVSKAAGSGSLSETPGEDAGDEAAGGTGVYASRPSGRYGNPYLQAGVGTATPGGVPGGGGPGGFAGGVPGGGGPGGFAGGVPGGGARGGVPGAGGPGGFAGGVPGGGGPGGFAGGVPGGGGPGGFAGGMPGGGGGPGGVVGGVPGGGGPGGFAGGVPGGGGPGGFAGGVPGGGGPGGFAGGVPGGGGPGGVAGGVPGGGGPGGVAGGMPGGGGPGGVAGGVPGGGGPGGFAGGVPGGGGPGGVAGGVPGGGGPGGFAGGVPGGGGPGAVPGSDGGSSVPNGGSQTGASRGVAYPEGYVVGRPGGDPPPNRDPVDTSMEAGQPGQLALPPRPGEWNPTPPPPPKHAEDSDDKKDGKKHKPIDKRDDDWGLRKAGQNAFPITRQIHINCYPDRLVLVPERGVGQESSIPMPAGTHQAIDPLVRAVWEQMDLWGMAGKGMYWRPQLSIYVAPGAEQRFEDLKRMLRGSGLIVQKKP